jgi:hypothetical protein
VTNLSTQHNQKGLVCRRSDCALKYQLCMWTFMSCYYRLNWHT